MKSVKRIALIALTLLVGLGTANAKFLNFGVKAGLNVNKLHFNKDFDKDLISKSNSTGWEAGVMVEGTVPVIGVGFDVSLLYARMNNNTQAYITPNEVFNGKNAGKNFLMLPVNIKYKLVLPAISKIFAPFVFTGPDFAFKLDKNIVDSMKTRTCQIAWNFGLGLEFFQHLQLAASYGLGITNIADKIHLVNAPDYSVKNNYWTVTAVWLF